MHVTARLHFVAYLIFSSSRVHSLFHPYFCFYFKSFYVIIERRKISETTIYGERNEREREREREREGWRVRERERLIKVGEI